jgi:TRAP-type uncharacterized transport system substrate-binding protein
MKSGTIDAMFFSGGLPDARASPTCSPPRAEGEVHRHHAAAREDVGAEPGLPDGRDPGDVYKTGAAVPTIVVPNVLLVREDLDPNIAVRADEDALRQEGQPRQGERRGEGHQPDNAKKTDPVTIHRGAAKALTDLGAK